MISCGHGFPKNLVLSKQYGILDKNFSPMLKKYIFACKMDGKWIFSHVQNFFMSKKSFFIHFTSKYTAMDIRLGTVNK